MSLENWHGAAPACNTSAWMRRKHMGVAFRGEWTIRPDPGGIRVTYLIHKPANRRLYGIACTGLPNRLPNLSPNTRGGSGRPKNVF